MNRLSSPLVQGTFEAPRYVGNGRFTTSKRWATPRFNALKQVNPMQQKQVVEAHLKQLSSMPIITKNALATRYLGNLLKQGSFMATNQHQAVYDFVKQCAQQLQQAGNQGLYPERFARMMNDYASKYKLRP